MDNTEYAQPETLNISLRRAEAGQSWGFRLQGGTDFSTPLSIQVVQSGSVSHIAGIMAGDGILMINNINTDTLTHEQAKMEIIRSGNEINLLVKRGAVTIWKPKVTPLSDLRPAELTPVITATGDEVVTVQKTSLAKEYQDEPSNIGSSHNRSARPFGPGSPPIQNVQPVPNVVHSQYNTPIGLYSAGNLASTYADQTSAITENLKTLNVSDHPIGSQVVAGGYRPVQASSPPVIAKDVPSGFRSVCAPKTDFDAVQKQQKLVQHMRCGGCDMLVTGVFVKAKDKPYHPGCFKCATCNVGLKQRGYFVIEDTLYCETHARRHAQPPGPDMVSVPVYR